MRFGILCAGAFLGVMAATLVQAVVACGSRVPIVEAVESHPTPWCYSASYRYTDSPRVHSALACWENERACAMALQQTVRLGSMVGVQSVTSCVSVAGVSP